MNEVSLVGEIRGFFISVFRWCVNECVHCVCPSNSLLNRTFFLKGGKETYRATKNESKSVSGKKENKRKEQTRITYRTEE